MSNATLAILDSLVWDRNPPEVEQALATDEATRLLRHEITDRVGILRVVAALRHSPLAALEQLQRIEPWASDESGQVELPLFEAHILGAAGGGVSGPYARTFFAILAAARPYLASIH